MAKDPAMLWYWGDWHSGTVLMSRFLKGCYIDLLHAQFNNGPLSLEEIKAVLSGDFGQAWPSLSKKFKESEKGLFFNERLEFEKNKRQQFCESRKKNREKTYDATHDKHMNGHMIVHMENENRIEVLDEKKKYRIEDCLKISLADQRYVRANTTNQAELQKFNDYLERQGVYEINPLDYKKYFAKLKGKYPDLIKTKLSSEDFRRLIEEKEKLNT